MEQILKIMWRPYWEVPTCIKKPHHFEKMWWKLSRQKFGLKGTKESFMINHGLFWSFWYSIHKCFFLVHPLKTFWKVHNPRFQLKLDSFYLSIFHFILLIPSLPFIMVALCIKLLTSHELVKIHYHGLVLSLFSHFCFCSSGYDGVIKEDVKPSWDVRVRLLIIIYCLALV